MQVMLVHIQLFYCPRFLDHRFLVHIQLYNLGSYCPRIFDHRFLVHIQRYNLGSNCPRLLDYRFLVHIQLTIVQDSWFIPNLQLSKILGSYLTYNLGSYYLTHVGSYCPTVQSWLKSSKILGSYYLTHVGSYCPTVQSWLILSNSCWFILSNCTNCYDLYTPVQFWLKSSKILGSYSPVQSWLKSSKIMVHIQLYNHAILYNNLDSYPSVQLSETFLETF